MNFSKNRLSLVFLAALAAVAASYAASPAHEPTTSPAAAYHGTFREVPLADVQPEGWLKEILCRQRDGLGLNHNVSGFPLNTCLWNGVPKGANWGNYAETAYLVDGLYRLGVLLQDQRLIDLGEANVKYVLGRPQPNGKLGPPVEQFGERGPLDIWCFTFNFFTRAMMADYEVTHNQAILDALTKHYLSLPKNHGSQGRDVDDVEGMCWLFGQTGDARILQIAQRTWDNYSKSPSSPWNLANLAAAKPMKQLHGVTVCEATKQPALLYLYTGDKKYLDAVEGGFRSVARDHELVDGVISSDEGLHGQAPEGVHETCDIIDYTWSLGYLLMASGDAAYGDKIERAIYNAGLGAIDKQFKALQYFSSPNQLLATHTSSAPKFGAGDYDRQAYRPGFAVQCCAGNVHRMMPNFALRQWMTDGRGGVVAALYAPSVLKTKVASSNVTLAEKTDYPFSGEVELAVTCDAPTAFPLYLRIPGWADGATVTVNGKPAGGKVVAGRFFKLERTFASGDRVQLNFPMNLRLEHPVAGGASVLRGPLVFALKIQEKREKVTKGPNIGKDFPAWNITPASPWNYALVLGPDALSQIKVSARPASEFPWTPDSAPVVLTAPARRVQGWDVTADGKNPALPQAPLNLAPQTEQVQLIPAGATQIRLSVFPCVEKAAQ